MTEGNQSEVSHIRQQIAREHHMAEWARTGLIVGTAKHRFISRRMDAIGRQQEALASLIGEEASMQLVVALFEGDSPPPRSH